MRNKENKKEYNKRYYLLNKENKLEYNKNYRSDNKEKNIEYNKNYQLQNKDKIKEQRKQYYSQNKESRLKYQSNRRKTDINYKLSCLLRERLNKAITNNQKSGSSVKDLGCTIIYLKQWLENQFKKGMNWGNHGEWHIDHQIPLSIVDLTNIEDLKQVCHYTNLQPMWADENIKKGCSIERAFTK